ncbi:MAG: HlyD family efflux transporter periplasmic adaptor subunit [Hyphomicrobiales bacterium]
MKRLSALVQIEADLRASADVSELGFILVNSLHKIVENEHALVWYAHSGKVSAVSGGVSIDHDSIQTRWFANVFKRMAKTQPDQRVPKEILPEHLSADLAAEFSTNIPAHLAWVPLLGTDNRLYGGILVLLRRTLDDAETRILERVANAAAFVLSFHIRSQKSGLPNILRPIGNRWVQLLGLAAVAFAMFIPIELSVLAPAKSAPSNPAIISAPLDGVIRNILVPPNQAVTRGEVVARMETNELQAAFEVANRRAAVLAADLRRATQKAFFEDDAKAQISLLLAQLREREAERDLAQERLSRVELRAPIDGVAILADQNEWTGRPVRTGERILIVAKPTEALLEILIPVEDAVVVEEGAKIEFFSSVSPNKPIKAVLERVAYTSSVQPDQTLAFRAEARFSEAETPPRLGFTGTAKIFSDKVPLYYALFRKPAATIRRTLGF